MSKSVSNDALWEKLSEIEEKINKYSQEQKTSVTAQEQVDISPELTANKAEIVDIFKRCIQRLRTHCNSHFKVIHKNIELFNERSKDGFQVLSYMWAWMQEKEEERAKIEQEKVKLTSEQETENSYLNLKFFKIRKTSLVIAVLGLLVFILTVFSMKQQNDYSLLLDEHYRQDITIGQLKVAMDSINTANQERMSKKR
jgi:hypothetical protein